MELEKLGFDDAWADAHDPDLGEPARVAVAHRGGYDVITAAGPLRCAARGRLLHEADDAGELPVVGDWVVVSRVPGEDKGMIEAVTRRRTVLVRRAVGGPDRVQPLAANLDRALVLVASDQGLRRRGLERYLTMCLDAGIEPVVVLTKADLEPDPDAVAEEVRGVARGVLVLSVSATEQRGLEPLRAMLRPTATAALLGPSGAGKSTLANALCGEGVFATEEVRSDGKGRHTSVRRELVVVPSGGVLIDTPGMRELGLWDADDGASALFGDIEELLEAGCRFNDCSHTSEPGCEILGAIDEGRLDAERWRSYLKQRRELDDLARRRDQRAAAEEKRRGKRPSRDGRDGRDGRRLSTDR